MPGRIYDQLLELAQSQHGFLRTADLRELGINPKRLVDYTQRRIATRVSQGVYRLKAVPAGEFDEYMQAAMWPTGEGVLSHSTALDLYALCDVNPAHIDITVPKRYRTHRVIPRLYRLHHADLSSDQRTYFRRIPIVTPAQAILEAITSGLRRDLLDQAILTASNEGLIPPEELEKLRIFHGEPPSE